MGLKDSLEFNVAWVFKSSLGAILVLVLLDIVSCLLALPW
jgi:hypothetical protein